MATKIKSAQILDGAIVAADLHSAIAINTTQSGTFGSVIVDNFTLDGTTLALSSGNLVIDSAGDIHLDTDGQVKLDNNGVLYGNLFNSSNDLGIHVAQADQRLVVSGSDDGTPVNAFILDMANGGRATFNENVSVGGDLAITGNIDGDVVITGDLTVEGAQVTLETTALDVEDKNITLNYHASNDTSASADGAGITIQDAVSSGNDASILWNASTDQFDFSNGISVNNGANATHLTLSGTAGRGLEISTATNSYTDNTAVLNAKHSQGILSFQTASVERLHINKAGNIGFGVTPNANWSASYRAIDAFGGATLQFEANSTRQGQNFYGYPWKYKATRTASSIAHTSGGDISFQVAPSGTADADITWSQAMLIKNGGNVGIGTDSPNTPLEVHGSDIATGATTTASSVLRLVRDVVDPSHTLRKDSAVDFMLSRQQAVANNLPYTRLDIRLAGETDSSTPSLDVMSLLHNGNVGIGSTSPSDRLEVLRTSTDQTVGLTLTNTQPGGYGSGIVWKSKRGDAPQAIKEAAKIVVTGANSWGSDNNTASQMQFWTQKDNTLTKHMTLSKNGKLGIGIASPGNTLHVNSLGHNTYSSTVTKGTNHTGLSIVQEGGNTDMTGVFFGSGGSGSGSHWSAITGSRTAHASHWGTQLNFYTHANDTANLADATQKMIITGDGNVGIGTDSPSATLEITSQIGDNGGGASTVDYPLVISQEDVGNTVDQGIGAGVGILFKNATNSSSEIGSAIASMRASASDGNTSNELAFFVSDNDTTLDEVVRIDVNGNVGIGTDDPDCALDVTRTSGWAEMHLDGASGGDLILKDNGVSYGEVYAGNGHGLTVKSYASQDIYFLTDANATPKMVIESGGNVGIGVDPAVHKLDVDGAIATRQVRHDVRPTLNLDFTNSKSLDSRFTFFRPSTATYTDSHGTIRYASHNTPRYDWDPLTGECLGLLFEEETTNHCSASVPGSGHGQFSSHLDSYPAQTLAPDGTMSGVLLVEQSTEQQLMYAAIGTVGTGTKWTWSIYIKAGHANADSLYMTSYGESVNATFNPNNGTSSGHSSRVMTDVGNGWYRCQLTFTKTNTTGTFYIGFSGSTRAPDYQNRHYIWGAQIENKDFSTSFIPTLEKFTSRATNGTYHDSTGQLVTAHDGEARYSHRWNGAEWIPTGLLREKSATHLDGGDNVNLSNWGATNCTLNGTTATTAPDGSFTAQKYVETGSGSIIHRLAGPVFQTTDQNTVSVYLKDDGSDTNVFINAGATLAISMLVQPSTGTILDTHEGANTKGWFGVEYAGNGWWRYYMGAEGINGNNRVYIGSVDDDHGTSGDDYYVADGTSGFYIWGYQRENERMMTSFIYSRWMGSTTRAADVVNFEPYTRQPDNLDMYNAKELIGQAQGTVFTEWATKEPTTGYGGVFELQDEILGYTGIPSNGIDQRTTAFYMTGNFAVSYPGPAQNTFTKTAFAYDATSVLDSRAAKDGVLGNTNTVHKWNMKLTRISIGRIDINNAYILNGHIKKFRLYTDRLSDDTLKALTENN